jgi:hypothetical protein
MGQRVLTVCVRGKGNISLLNIHILSFITHPLHPLTPPATTIALIRPTLAPPRPRPRPALPSPRPGTPSPAPPPTHNLRSESADRGSASQQQSSARIEKCEEKHSVSHSFEKRNTSNPRLTFNLFKFQTKHLFANEIHNASR